MRYLIVLFALTACKATPQQIAATACDPTTDVEQCDDTNTRRMTCNAQNGQWTPFQLCMAPQVCVLSGPSGNGGSVSACETVNPPTDAMIVGDGSFPDQKPTTDGSLVDGGADVPDAQAEVLPDDSVQPSDLLPNQSCFQAHCPTQTLMCLTYSTCIADVTAWVQCAIACGGGQGCIAGCESNSSDDATAFALVTCYPICLGGCGDGVCEANETPTTCPGDCKPASTGSCYGACGGQAPTLDCYCDTLCTKKGDCCADFASACPQ